MRDHILLRPFDMPFEFPRRGSWDVERAHTPRRQSRGSALVPRGRTRTYTAAGDPSYYSTKYGTGLRFSSCSKRPSYNCVNPRRRCCLGGTKLQRCSVRHTLVCDAGPPAELAFHDPRVDERPSKGRRADGILSNTYVLRVMTLDPRYRLSNHHRFRPSCALSRGSRRRWLRRRLPVAGGVVIHRLCSHNVSL